MTARVKAWCPPWLPKDRGVWVECSACQWARLFEPGLLAEASDSGRAHLAERHFVVMEAPPLPVNSDVCRPSIADVVDAYYADCVAAARAIGSREDEADLWGDHDDVNGLHRAGCDENHPKSCACDALTGVGRRTCHGCAPVVPGAQAPVRVSNETELNTYLAAYVADDRSK